MTADDSSAIGQFRRLHIAGMLFNVAMLAALCVGMKVIMFSKPNRRQGAFAR